MPIKHCPTSRQLTAFVLGDLDDAELDDIAEHISDCVACEATLDELDGMSDSMIDRIRNLEPAHPWDATVPLGLLNDAQSAISHALDEGQELIVDVGRRIADALEEGPYRLGRFELGELLGVGSFGYVFRAKDPELDREVAVKVQRRSNLGRKEESDRFQREARSIAQLQHPNIVSLFEVGETEDNVSYLVTEYIRGCMLEERIRTRSVRLGETVTLVSTIARALDYAHGKGVIHRDIKPANIQIDEKNEPFVMDFGLAKRDTNEVTVTAEGEIMGTPAYMSPELAFGDSHHVDARSDVFSLGTVLYELLTGNQPFRGHRRMVLRQLMEDDPRPLRQLNDDIPRDLETICLKAMSKEPARRYATAGQFADDLDRFAAGESILARPMGPGRRLQVWCRRNPFAASLFLAVILGSTTGFLYLSSLSRMFVEDSALHSVEMQAEMLDEINGLYSEIVERITEHGMDVTHEYPDKSGTVPLPANFTIIVGQRMSAAKTGMVVRLYSDYPFPWRVDGGPQDEFERVALDRLRRDPTTPHYEFSEVDGRPVLRFASARVMKASCVSCHNNHADTPKTDWKVGDVRGVLEIIRPLSKDVERVRSGLRSSFVVIVGMSFVLIAAAVSMVLVGQARQRRKFSEAALT